MKKLGITETMADCVKARPFLKPFLNAFEPLFTQRQATAERLASLLSEAGLGIKGSTGKEPLLPKNLPAGLGSFVKLAAQDLLPLLLRLETVAQAKTALERFFLAQGKETELESLLSAMLADSPDELLALAKKLGLPPEMLEFVSEFIVSALLRALRMASESADYSDWHKSICPVCGNAPVIAWLARRPLAGDNEFLVGGGGKKYLHCGMCGADWRFVRGICPGCGEQGQDAMQILGEEERRHERIDWCKKCHSYLPQIDLREMAADPDMDAMALGMMHLDLVAKKKNLLPLKPSFWNMN